MGIHRFGFHLKKYASRTTLGSTSSPAINTFAILDGPGVAHYIYYGLCHTRSGSTERISYCDVARAVVKWLDTATSIGYKVNAILFDGALPASKKNVRIERMQSYIGKLQSYRQGLGSGVPKLSGRTKASLPSPPFLVFSVVEELLQHEVYRSITYVVNGEADGYCVAAAQCLAASNPESTIAIFSDDADLLVYEIGSNTCVVPLRELSESRFTGNTTWTGDLYWSAQIVKQLSAKLQDLVKPAFYMAQDPYRTLVDACQQVRASNPEGKAEFASFSESFQLEQEMAGWTTLTTKPVVKDAMAARDSRISELISQLQQDSTQGGLRMYLPFLLDDLSRATAWNACIELRTIAYSTLLRACKTDGGIQEYRRSGLRVASTSIDVLEDTELDKQVVELASHIKQVRSWCGDQSEMSNDDAWRYLAMQHTLQHLHTEGYAVPSVQELVPVVTNTQGEHSWRHSHLSAQYQAAFYSLRMLRQIVTHVIAMSATEHEGELVRLHTQLNGLPRITTFFEECVDDSRVQTEGTWRGILQEMMAAVGVEGKSQPRSKKRKRDKQAEKSGDGASSSLTKNPFAMLGSDW